MQFNDNGDDDTDLLTGTPADEPTGPTVITSPRISRTPMTTVTCSSSTHSIPINVILPPLSLLDAHNSVDSLSPTTQFFQQNWLSTAAEQGSMDTQQQQQQQPAFLSPQPFCYSYYGLLGSASYKSPSCASSYFDFSHVDVVMDHGSRQKRTVSLSTVPRFPLFHLYCPPELVSMKPRNYLLLQPLITTTGNTTPQQRSSS
ncbi:unnamed protein product [Absidia cylindrospora]